MGMVQIRDNTNTTRSDSWSTAGPFPRQLVPSKWLLGVVVAGLLLLILTSLPYFPAPHSLRQYLRSSSLSHSNRDDDETRVWINVGGYAMKIDPTKLAVVEHEDGAVSLVEPARLYMHNSGPHDLAQLPDAVVSNPPSDQVATA